MDTSSFVDGFGRRLRTVDATGEQVETLRLCRELSDVASTEAALIERAGRLAAFTHPSFAQVRRVERMGGALGGLAVVSTAVPGIRLSELLRDAQRKWVAPDFDAVACLLQQVTGAMADFHRLGRDLAHGAVGPERIVVRPDGRAVIVEQVLGPAIEQLQMGRTPLWTQFRVPVPAVAGTARLDQMTDVLQLGVLALALVLGRPIRRDEYPHHLQDLLTEASTPDALGERRTLSRGLRSWILRTFQLEARSAFRSAADAVTALDGVLSEAPRPDITLAAVVKYTAACSSVGDEGPSSPAVTAAPMPAGAAPMPGGADECAVGIITATDRFATVRVFHPAVPGPEPPHSQVVTEAPGTRGEAPAGAARPTGPIPAGTDAPGAFASSLRRVLSVVAAAARATARYAGGRDWASTRRSVRVAALSASLVALYGVTYLGARGYLGLPNLIGGRGTLVVESRPAGIDLYVDGFPSGMTPATLDLRAGEHTLVLRTGKGLTLVPVEVVAGARRVEFVEVRQRRLGPRAKAAAAPLPLPPRAVPQ